LAQASQSSAAIWLTDDTASRVISDESIDDLNRSRVYDQPSLMVTIVKIVHCTMDFKMRIYVMFWDMIPKNEGWLSAYGRNPSKII
jgi:hypothetical protein